MWKHKFSFREHSGQPKRIGLNWSEPQLMAIHISATKYLYMNEQNYNRLDNLIALPCSNKVQWVAVGHTHMHTYNKTEAQINGMLEGTKNTGRFFTRKFVQFFNGRKGLYNCSHPNNPLIISHLHTGKLNNTSSTIHYHFAFGNIPTGITQQEMMTVFEELWVHKAKQSSKSIWLQQASNENKGWITYGHRENRLGAQLGLDIHSTFIPNQA
jgi:hypothetical protein